eukprot:TRINITY_DN5576_c0_g2_i2.p1 TRINITY_DN5576_c0_g2~~TRINITY_DN5576_c0_g2_i2.p1  ORF type:complete len:323 (-),score=77.45 TRINITY_DN5576_c0_g2_i2:56-1024(-)
MLDEQAEQGRGAAAATGVAGSPVVQYVVGIPAITKLLALVVLLQSLLWAVAPFSPAVYTINPATSFWPFVYTTLTASFLERSVIGVALGLLGLVYIGRQLESTWGSLELLRFVGVVTVTAGTGALVLTSLLGLAAYFCTAASTNAEDVLPLLPLWQRLLWHAQVSGLGGLLCGYMVALKQRVDAVAAQAAANSLVLVGGPGAGMVRYLPLIYIGLSALPCALSAGVSSPADETATVADVEPSCVAQVLFAFCGFAGAWVYLRFFQITLVKRGGFESATVRGDASDALAFHTFFPPVMQGPIKVVEKQLSRLGRGAGALPVTL